MRPIKHPKNKDNFEFYIKGLQGGDFTLKQVSFITGYSTRQLTNIKKQYTKEGVKAFENGHKGMKPKNRIPDKIKRQIVNIYKTEFLGFNFHFFVKALDEFYGIHYSYKTVYNILTKNGVASPEKRKVKKNKPVHRPRYRRERSGELVQIDATPYQWFEWCGDTAYYTLHGAIDDAEGSITGLCMTENECSYGYYDILEQTIDNHGVMLELYSDRSAIFCVNPKDKYKLSPEEQLQGIHAKRTQWQRILDDLQIKQILAWSPQAKGRVERMWRTLQGRLPWYFKHYNIKTMEAANAFLKKNYIKIFNDEFAIKREKKAIWRNPAVNHYKEFICAKFARTTNNSGVISFQGYKFQIEAPHCVKKKIQLCIYKNGIKALVDGVYHSVKLLEDLTDGIGEQMSISLKNIIHQYMLTDAKRVSA